MGPVSSKKNPASLAEYSTDVLCSQIVQLTRYASKEEKIVVKGWLSDLPAATRTFLMQKMFQYKQTPSQDPESRTPDLTR